MGDPKNICPTPKPVLPGTLKVVPSLGRLEVAFARSRQKQPTKTQSTQPEDKHTLLTATGKHKWLKTLVLGPPRGGGRAQAPPTTVWMRDRVR